MISEQYQQAKRVIFINKQLRRYYGKKYYRQAQTGESGRAQTRLTINQSRASKSRLSESEAGTGSGKETEVITGKAGE